MCIIPLIICIECTCTIEESDTLTKLIWNMTFVKNPSWWKADQFAIIYSHGPWAGDYCETNPSGKL